MEEELREEIVNLLDNNADVRVIGFAKKGGIDKNIPDEYKMPVIINEVEKQADAILSLIAAKTTEAEIKGRIDELYGIRAFYKDGTEIKCTSDNYTQTINLDERIKELQALSEKEKE